MGLPEAIAREVDERAISLGSMPQLPEPGGTCVGSKYHTPRPLVTYRVRLLDGSVVTLCGCCRDNLALLDHLTEDDEQPLPWDAHRQFGNIIRELGKRR